MTWSWLVLLIVCGLATFRITRLVVKDDFPPVRIPREWVIGRPTWRPDSNLPKGGEWVQDKHEGTWYEFFGELISCHWCASGWVSLAITLALALLTPRDAPVIDWIVFWWATWGVGAVTADKAG